ncbi:MAG: class I SAM-dependent methyltransferase, partial [Gloeomargaritaceae cyanobacterium C42_A2020_066]|nr:class I SAM-dependent methyltransferase [Gloeomargaritaceae cyanobacterium C42_A2020_066]
MSDLQDWIAQIYTYPELLGMGHAQRLEDLNLGLGWLYYALPRILRCQTVVVIGSYRGFVPLVLGRALQDNKVSSQVIFIDPSFVDEFWNEPEKVKSYFLQFEVENIRHFRCTTQEFVRTDAYQCL